MGGGAFAGLGAMGLSGCGAASSSPNDLTLMVWASTSEEAGFRAVIESYAERNPEANITLDVIPFDNYVKLNTLLAAGLAPDLVRVQYQLLGRYSSTGVFTDLSEYLEPNYGDAFTPAIWQAVNYEGSPYALPHHTDTMAIFYGNVRNTGLVPNLPEETCVEVPILVDGTGLAPCHAGELPPHLAATCQPHTAVQNLTVRAALEGRRDNIYHAAMLDRHAPSVLSMAEIRAMVDEMIEAHGDAMPSGLRSSKVRS